MRFSFVFVALIGVLSGLAQGGSAMDAKADYRVGDRLSPSKPGAPAEVAYQETDWDTLIPKGWDPMQAFKGLDLGRLKDADPRAMDALQALKDAWDNAPVESSLRGRRIRIAGFMIPLERKGEQVTEFLLVAGKALAIAATLGIVLVPVLLLGVLALALAGDGQTAVGDSLSRVAVLATGYAIYLGGFVALTLGVSATVSSSRQALVLLLAFWMVNSFVAPRAMTDLARRLSPTPTAMEFRQAMAADRRATWGDDDKHPAFAAFRERVLKDYGVARVEDLPVDFRGLALRADDENGYRIYDRHFGELWERYARQERIRALAGLIFPLAAIQPFSMGMAGTDTAHHNHFAQAAENYRREIQSAMSDDLIHHRKNGDEHYVAGRSLWEKIQPFHYRAPSVASAVARQWPNAVILALWAAATGLFAFLAVRRLSPV